MTEAEISLVHISSELIAKVAERANVTPERVRAYLKDAADQDRVLTRVFLFYGVGPFGKTL